MKYATTHEVFAQAIASRSQTVWSAKLSRYTIYRITDALVARMNIAASGTHTDAALNYIFEPPNVFDIVDSKLPISLRGYQVSDYRTNWTTLLVRPGPVGLLLSPFTTKYVSALIEGIGWSKSVSASWTDGNGETSTMSDLPVDERVEYANQSILQLRLWVLICEPCPK